MRSHNKENNGIRDLDERISVKSSPQVETMESKVARLEAEIIKLKEQIGIAKHKAWRASRKRETPMLWNPLKSHGSLLG